MTNPTQISPLRHDTLQDTAPRGLFARLRSAFASGGPDGDGKRPEGEGPNQGGDPNGQDGQGSKGVQPSRGMFGLVSILLILLLLVIFASNPGRGQKIAFQEFETLYKNNELDRSSVVLENSALVARRVDTQDGTPGDRVSVAINETSRRVIAEQVYELTGGQVTAKPESPFTNIIWFFGPMILLLLVMWFLISRGLRNVGGGGGMLGSFGKSKHRTLTKEMTGITFKDVAGVEEAKEEVSEIIEFLKNPKKFTRIGGRIPRGVLLSGAPGCGKTLLAKAIAGEADVPFFSISGSDFVEMFVGVGASRVRDLFKQAKDNAPCIIFLDEIDAVGRRRGGGFSTGGHDEREQTLNAILVEMDGFSSTEGVIVVAATNRPDVLDPALTRPGRFDRQIAVPLPDVVGRMEILKVHATKVKLGPDVDIEKLARGTPMFSGADLAAIINEAAISATLLNKDFVEHEDLEEARDKVKFGRAKKSRVREKEENKLVAYHEAGHAVLQHLLTHTDPLHKVTIIPRGAAGGATFSLPEKDRMGYSLKWINDTMRVLCGGRIAEEKAMEDVSSGASQDIAQVTQLSRTMITEWGMSDSLGFVRYAGMDTQESYMPDREFSDETAEKIDSEVRRLVDDAYGDAKRILEQHWDEVVRVAEALLRYETLSADEVAKIMDGNDLGRPTVSELLAMEAEKPIESAPKIEPADDGEPDLPPGAMPSPA
ncbi:MAG: ATP-dependent zinc metalloprotease FtsH [Planctomycetota bacterium]